MEFVKFGKYFHIKKPFPVKAGKGFFIKSVVLLMIYFIPTICSSISVVIDLGLSSG